MVFLTPAQAKKTPPSQPLDLNTATVSQLEELPGIGPTRATKIVEFRMKTPFRRIEDLMVVPGISKARFDKLKPYIKVSPPASPSSSQKPSHTAAKPVATSRASATPTKPAPKSPPPSDSCSEEEPN